MERALTLHPAADRPGRLEFSGSPEAELFSREVAESLAGILRENLIPQRTPDGYPPGFVRASVPPRPWCLRRRDGRSPPPGETVFRD